MISGGPDRPLILPPRSDDIFSPNYSPDLAAHYDQNHTHYTSQLPSDLVMYSRHRKPEKAGLLLLGGTLSILISSCLVLWITL